MHIEDGQATQSPATDLQAAATTSIEVPETAGAEINKDADEDYMLEAEEEVNDFISETPIDEAPEVTEA